MHSNHNEKKQKVVVIRALEGAKERVGHILEDACSDRSENVSYGCSVQVNAICSFIRGTLTALCRHLHLEWNFVCSVEPKKSQIGDMTITCVPCRAHNLVEDSHALVSYQVECYSERAIRFWNLDEQSHPSDQVSVVDGLLL